MSIVTAWSPFFQSGMRMRGRAYHLAGRVTRVEPEDGELIRANVQGRELYSVVIRKEGRAAIAECTCPTFNEGAFCKHIWATLLDVQHAEGEGPGASSDDLSGLRVRAPKARKRDEADAARPAAEPEWVGRLSLLRAPTVDAESRSAELLPPQRELGYVVLPGASSRHGGLVVEVRHRTPTVTGWSRLKPLKLNSETVASLPDPTDRELCALILGAAQVDDYTVGDGLRERSHSVFRLPTSARRSLLQRMIATERCYVDADEDAGSGNEVPLHWDDDERLGPWVLWLVGSETDDELVVHVELRRAHEKLSIDEPKLVLGGADGLVVWGRRAAPLDDRGATRWITQFRGEKRGMFSESRGPLRIARADVSRFLDRLYMLPSLPEIDLPESLTRNELQVTTRPHLELFGPDSKQAAELGGGSAIKNQLLARAWFDYAGQRVDPMQPGRFVTVQAPQAEAPVEAAAPVAVTAGGGPDGGDNDAPPTDGLLPDEPDPLAEIEASLLGDDFGNEDELAAEAAADSGTRLIRRDARAEREAFATLASLGFRQASNSSAELLLIHSRQMPAAVAELIGRGWVVSADQRILRRPGAPALAISSGLDWFELRGGVTYERADGETQEVGLPEILAAVRSGDTMITLGDGSMGLLPEEWLQEHGLLTTLGKLQGDALRFKSSQAALIDALLHEDELVTFDEPFRRIRERLHQFNGVTPREPHPNFRGKLRPYQREGLGWVAFLRDFGMGGILADDMGLGKTIQILAMLQARRHAAAEEGRDHAPSLIVAPRSVIFNWLDEAQKFTPELRTVAYTGGDREALRGEFDNVDVIVTSYGLLRRDVEELRERTFDYVVLDEAQAIKNPNSQAAKAARLMQARHRLALTGTPIENHLGDLWSIFEFLNPGMLGAGTRFGEVARAGGNGEPLGPNGNGHADDDGARSVAQLAKALRPFILRRTKKQVLADLPEKTEQNIVCEMEPAQRQVYDDLRRYYRGHLLEQIDAAPGAHGNGGPTIAGRSAFMVLEALLRLRQAACHPGLIDANRIDDPSAKLDTLLEMLGDVMEEGGKALIFSQFTSMLAIVRKRLEAAGIPYCYLDGQTRDRRRVVERFQNDPTVPVFLISLKAGGFGLNLTAAEYVFIMDPWWNPAVEAQAIDRTHRIGQTRRVFAYRMICEDTVEQRILELQARKRKLADAIVDEQGDLLRGLTREDLEQLLT